MSHRVQVKGHHYCTLSFAISKTNIFNISQFFLNVVLVLFFKCCNDGLEKGKCTVKQSYTYLIMGHFDYDSSGYFRKHDTTKDL